MNKRTLFSIVLVCARTVISIIAISLFVSCSKDSSNPVKPPGETIKDIDGNTYQTVKIGNQLWMAENLKVKHYRNGNAIPKVISWVSFSDTTGAYFDYNNPTLVTTYGMLYNWYAVNDSRSIAPVGWHVPSYDEWYILASYLGGDDVAGDKMKEAGTTHWPYPNYSTNESGFSALPGGEGGSGTSDYGVGYLASFWSSTEYDSFQAVNANLFPQGSRLLLWGDAKWNACSIRCIKD